jgi:hypothetical protein
MAGSFQERNGESIKVRSWHAKRGYVVAQWGLVDISGVCRSIQIVSHRLSLIQHCYRPNQIDYMSFLCLLQRRIFPIKMQINKQ